jgi:hypothetical protein
MLPWAACHACFALLHQDAQSAPQLAYHSSTCSLQLHTVLLPACSVADCPACVCCAAGLGPVSMPVAKLFTYEPPASMQDPSCRALEMSSIVSGCSGSLGRCMSCVCT